MGWTVLWNTRPAANGRWNAALAGSEAEALERTAHFIKLGFFVHSITAPSGAVLMDEAQVATRFRKNVHDFPASGQPDNQP